MQATYATIATPGRTNEDYLAAGPDWAFVLDGATEPSGVDSGCTHGVPWLVRRLGGALARRLATPGGNAALVGKAVLGGNSASGEVRRAALLTDGASRYVVFLRFTNP